MALPTTVGSKALFDGGHIPPFKSSAGNFYVLHKHSVTDNNIRISKATDPTSSWTENNTSAPSINADVVSAVQDGDIIHIASYTGGTYSYHNFDMSDDTWGTVDQTIETPTSTPGVPWISIAQPRSDGTIVVVYDGDTDTRTGGERERVDYNIRSSGGTWGGPTTLETGDAQDRHFFHPNCVKAHDNDDVHVIWCRSNTSVGGPAGAVNTKGTTIQSGDDSISTAAVNGEDTGTVIKGIHNIVSYGDGGFDHIIPSATDPNNGFVFLGIEDGSGDISWRAGLFTNFADGSNEPFVTGAGVGLTTIAVDSVADLHVLWSNKDDSNDIYYVTSIDDAATWSTEAEEVDAIICNQIHSTVYLRDGREVLAYLYEDNTNTLYGEKDLGRLFVTVDTPNLVLSEINAVVAADTKVAVTTTNLVLAEVNAAIKANNTVTANTINLTLAPVTSSVNAHTKVAVSTAGLTLAGVAAVVAADTKVAVTTVNLTMTGGQHNIIFPKFITVTTVGLTLAGVNASVNAHTKVAVSTAGLTLNSVDTLVTDGQQKATLWIGMVF